MTKSALGCPLCAGARLPRSGDARVTKMSQGFHGSSAPVFYDGFMIPPPFSQRLPHVSLAVCIASFLFFSGTPLRAQNNPFYTPGDLVLFFQNPNGDIGSDQQVFASLGNTALVFRDSFVAGSNRINIININEQLTDAFGPDWANTTTLYGGAGGVWGNSGSLSVALQNGDPHRTDYTTRRRSTVGTPGQQNSTGYSIGSDGAMTAIANSMLSQNNILENGAQTAAAVIPVAPAPAPTIALNNPVGGNGWNQNVPGDSVMQAGQSGNYGSFSSVNDVEFMWDLFRIQAKNNINGQYGQGDPIRVGEFLGTLVLDSSGNVSFITSGGNPPATPYDTWAAGYPSATLTDKNADYDKDGFTNFQEFAFGTNPTIGNASLVSATTSGSDLVITAKQRTSGPSSGITSYTLQTRSDLTSGSWSSSGVTADTGTPEGDYTPVTYTVPRAGARGFYRLIATE
jgi:hypothetical protein